MREAEVIELVDAFIAGAMTEERWTHAAHVASAAYLVRTRGRRRALSTMRDGIQNLNRVLGSTGYHETLTVAWVDLLAGMVHEGRGEDAETMLRRVLAASADKQVMLEHYTRDRVMSEEARARFVPPDLRPLPRPDYALRDATPGDAERINAIYNHYVPWSSCTFALEPTSIEERSLWLSRRHRDHPAVVAETDGEVVGWGSLDPYRSRGGYAATAEISIYVDPSEHGRGLGRELTRRLMARAAEVGLHTIIAMICTEQRASLTAFSREGFVERGTMREVGRKLERWLDVAVLERRV